MKTKNKKNKIKEDTSMTSSYPTSTTTSSTTSTAGKNPTVYVKSQDLKKTVGDLKDTGATVMVTKENEVAGSELPIAGKLSYLSEVKDEKTGDVSQPFTINGKQYQVVRAISPDKQKTMGVYSIDERDEDGKNIIYDLKEFEENIAKKHLNEEPAPEETQIPQDTPDGEAKKLSFFEGHKHFIVNEKTGRVRKFKTIADVAKARMEDHEKYMGIKDFKKFLDESLFGKRSKALDEEPQMEAAPVVQEPAAVTHMFNLVDKALPKDVYDNIKQNPTAQESAINNWLTRIGVPATKVNNIVNTVRNLAKQTPTPNQTTNVTTTATSVAPAPVTESKKILKTIKVKDILKL